jgi:hypothetical protein
MSEREVDSVFAHETTLDKDGLCARRSVRGLDCGTAATGHLKVADIAMSAAEAASAALPHPTDRRPPRRTRGPATTSGPNRSRRGHRMVFCDPDCAHRDDTGCRRPRGRVASAAHFLIA